MLSHTFVNWSEKDSEIINNPIAYFRIEVSQGFEYIGWNNVLEKDFLVYSHCHAHRNRTMAYLEHLKLDKNR